MSPKPLTQTDELSENSALEWDPPELGWGFRA
jgi:hypothetical protein